MTHQLLGSNVRDQGQAGQHLQACQLALVLGGANKGQHGCKHAPLNDLIAGYAVVLPQQPCSQSHRLLFTLLPVSQTGCAYGGQHSCKLFTMYDVDAGYAVVLPHQPCSQLYSVLLSLLLTSQTGCTRGSRAASVSLCIFLSLAVLLCCPDSPAKHALTLVVDTGESVVAIAHWRSSVVIAHWWKALLSLFELQNAVLP